MQLLHCELGILLPHGFEEYKGESTFDAAATNGEIIVGITRISFAAAIEDGIPATLDTDKFAREYMARAGHSEQLCMYGDVPYYCYNDAAYSYYYTFYKSPHAYFCITFIASAGHGIEAVLSLTGKVYLILD